MPRVEIQISESQVQLRSAFLNDKHVLQDVAGVMRCSDLDEVPIKAELQLQSVVAGHKTGSVAMNLLFDPNPADSESARVQLICRQ